jgi:hypothetical protein
MHGDMLVAGVFILIIGILAALWTNAMIEDLGDFRETQENFERYELYHFLEYLAITIASLGGLLAAYGIAAPFTKGLGPRRESR